VRNYVLTVIAGTTTPVGASKPDAWVAVVDKQTQAEYFWNKESGVLVQLSCQQRR
jgi:GH18 family chitinase